MKRIGIYAHWDARAEVKRYVEHSVRRLREECDEVHFVSTSPLAQRELDKLRPSAATVRTKENLGYDFGMWRDVIATLDLTQLDELVLTNSSVFGPVRSLRDAFARMAAVPCDFWAMTDSEQLTWHLQSYFLVFRQKALRHPGFAQFWSSVLPYSNKRQVIYSYELGLTTFLTECGLEGRAFAPVERIAEVPPRWPWSSRRMHPTTNPSVYLPFTLLENEMPFVKVEVFRDNVARVPLDSLRRAIRATGYDLTLLEYDPR